MYTRCDKALGALIKVFPDIAVDNLVDQREANVKHGGKVFSGTVLACPQTANLPYLAFRQLGKAMLFPARIRLGMEMCSMLVATRD